MKYIGSAPYNVRDRVNLVHLGGMGINFYQVSTCGQHGNQHCDVSPHTDSGWQQESLMHLPSTSVAWSSRE